MLKLGILTTWEDNGKGLARDLVNDGHDVWEIEMNGGDNTECVTCPDYTYQDQVDYFWPVLVAGVMNYSGKKQAHYIGHSNGCRVALSSLNSYSKGKNGSGWAFNTQTGLYDLNISLPNRSVDKFFGFACPATSNDNTTFTNLTRRRILNNAFINGNYAMARINQSGNIHIRRVNYLYRLIEYGADPFSDIATLIAAFEDERISRNLMQFYNDLSINDNTNFNINNVNVSELHLFNSNPSDFIVGKNDQDRIIQSTNIPVEIRYTIIGPIPFFSDHSAMKNRFDEEVTEGLR